jgi:hypothetical protein
VSSFGHLWCAAAIGAAGASPSHLAAPDPTALALAVFGLACSLIATDQDAQNPAPNFEHLA